MKRQEKVKEIEFLNQRFAQTKVAYLASFQGMKVDSVNQLRKNLRPHAEVVKVVKNTLAKRAAKDTELDLLSEEFKGATTLIIPHDDVVQTAKVLVDYKKQDKALTLRRGFLRGKLLEVKDFEQLAKVPSREELLARLMGSMKSPISNFVYALSDSYRRVVYAFKAVAEKKEKEGN